MTTTPEMAARISADEAPPAPVNEAFRNYVQSTAFSLSLSRRQVTTFIHLETGIDKGLPIRRWPVHDATICSLIKRGLVVELQPEDREKVRFTGEDPPITWDQHYAITTAGKLVLQLLSEAGLIPRRSERLLPPPAPPGWTDPRPRITFDEDLNCVTLPSKRERHAVEVQERDAVEVAERSQ